MGGALAKLTAGREGRYFPFVSSWMRSNWVKTDSPNSETETANRTLQSGSLTVPGEDDKISFQMVAVVL